MPRHEPAVVAPVPAQSSAPSRRAEPLPAPTATAAPRQTASPPPSASDRKGSDREIPDRESEKTRPAEPSPGPVVDSVHGIADADAWHEWVMTSGLKGPARQLAEHAVFVGYAEGVLRLSLGEHDEHLRTPLMVQRLADALKAALGAPPQVRFEAASVRAESVHARKQRARDARQTEAEDTFMNDPDVQRLITQHGARVVPDSIRPFDET
jgi:DNA polymerase-3 subunit gamma/tau